MATAVNNSKGLVETLPGEVMARQGDFETHAPPLKLHNQCRMEYRSVSSRPVAGSQNHQRLPTNKYLRVFPQFGPRLKLKKRRKENETTTVFMLAKLWLNK